MRQKQLLIGAAAVLMASTLPAMALLKTNHNALGNGPVVKAGFQKPPENDKTADELKAEELRQAAELKKTEELKDAELRKAEGLNGTPSRMAHAKAEAGMELPAIVASVYNYATGEIGMYRLPEVSGGEMEKLSDVSSYYGGTLHNNLYYACDDGRFDEYWDTDTDPHGHRMQTYDINTWQKVGDAVNLATYRASDLAIDPETGLGYAFCDYGSIMYHLYEINLQTGEETDLTPGQYFFSDESRALAFDSEGTLWGVTRNGLFGKVDLTTGKNSAMTDLGESGDLQHGYSGAIDPDTGNFLFMYNGSPDYNNTHESRLYSIDTQTGEATLLADFNGVCITSMYVMPEQIADKAPGTPSDITGTFPNGALTGTVSFTMPAKLHDGSDASGNATWRVYEGKMKIAEGTAAYGTEVKADVSVTAGGKHTFSVSVSNDAGEGKKGRLSMWVGPDYPKAPANIAVDYMEDTNTFTVTWDAVTEGANGGYVNPDGILYNVTQLPVNDIVAENTSATSATTVYVPDGIESVSFSVTARQGDLVSEAGMSAPTMTGSLALPYDLANAERYKLLESWTVIDANGDNNTWDEDSYNGIYYNYSSSNAADDWALTPPLKALKGCRYKVHAAFSCQMSSCPEKVEIKMGYAPTAEAMETVVLPATVIDQTDPMAFDFEVIPDRDGKMFIGIHAISDANMYKLKIKELTISAPVNENSPAAPEISGLEADRSGALTLTGTVKAPTLAENGTTLAAIDRIEVTRNGKTVATIENPVPGTEVAFSDATVDKDDEYEYIAYAWNGEMKSSPSEPVKTFVGINRPGEVENISIVRSGDNAKAVTVTWEAPAKDWQGYALNGDWTYNVEVYPDNAYYHGNKTYEGLTETSFTFEPVFDTGRDHGFVYVKVNAVNNAGGGYAEKSANIYCGEALPLPFKESFPNYTLEHPWGDGESNGPQIASITDDERALSYQQYNGWNRLMDASFQSADGSQDGDNGFAGMFGWSYITDTAGTYHNEWTELLSPAIDLSGVDKPMLTFYTYNWLQYNFADPNTIDVDVVTEDGTRHNALHLVISDLGNVQAWEHVAVDLSEFANRTVSLIFKGTIRANGENGYNWILIDNIRIDKLAATDLSVADIEAPVQAVPNEPFSVKARISNLGGSTVAAHKATLIHNGKEVATKDLGALGFSKSEIVEFTHSLGVKDPIGNVLAIRVEAEGDEITENNLTSEVTVARNLKLLPEPEKVYINPGGERLEWGEPDYSNAAPEAVKEDFESYPVVEQESFLTEAGDWIFIDVDGAPIGGMVSSSTWELLEYPGIPTHSAQSWWVQSRMFDEFSDTYYGHDNSMQYLANMYVVNNTFTAGVQQDDWAITPELCGREQLVTLWARSYNRDTPETVEFLYSEGGTEPESFKLIRRVEELPADWTQFALVVPEGGKRFAIRGCSYAAMGTAQTFIDDVTYYPATGDAQNLKLKGYNVYCDNSLLTTAPVATLECVELPAGTHEYAVSALYESGESRAVVAVEGSGIDGVDANSPVIAVRDNRIVLTNLGGKPWSVTAASGIVCGHGTGVDSSETEVSHGVYIVTINGRPHRLIVK